MPRKQIPIGDPIRLYFRSWSEMLRLKTLDTCLGSGKVYGVERLAAICSDKLEEEGEKGVSSKGTILSDIECLKLVWGAEIEVVRNGREIGYRYAQKGYSVFSLDYDSAELKKLQNMVLFLSALQEAPDFEWTSQLLEDLEKGYGLQHLSTDYVGFEVIKKIKGNEFFMPLYKAVTKHETLLLSYKSFWWKEPKKITVSPYYLKQYNQRWYLLAKNEATNKLVLYGLDRILDLETIEGTFSPCDCNPVDYFNDIVGVTNLKDHSVETIKLEVDRSYFDYIDNRPIHPSQCVESEDDEKVIVTLNVKVNVEFEKLLLSEALNIRVLEPQWLRMRIIDKLKKASDGYK